MKRTLLPFLLLIAVSSFAQTEATGKISPNYKLRKVQVNGGLHFDTYKKMDKATMYDFTKNPALYPSGAEGLEPEDWQRVNPGIGAQVNFSFLKSETGKGFSSEHREIRVGAAYFESEPYISSYERAPLGEDTTYVKSIMYCRDQKDIKLSGEYLFRTKNKGKSLNKFIWISAYAGLGGSIAFTTNKMYHSSYEHIEYTDSSLYDGFSNYSMNAQEDIRSEDNFMSGGYAAKSSLIGRAYIPAGVEVTFFEHLEFSLNSRVGIGMEQVIGGKTYAISTLVGANLGLGWKF